MAEIVLPEKLTVRAAVATVQVAVIQLIEAAGLAEHLELDELTVNINFDLARIDIATLSEDKQHVGEWLCGFSIDPQNLSAFGTPVGLPGFSDPTGQTH